MRSASGTFTVPSITSLGLIQRAAKKKKEKKKVKVQKMFSIQNIYACHHSIVYLLLLP